MSTPSMPAVALLVALLIGVGVQPAGAADCEYSGVERVVAIGDVHGAHDELVGLLQTAGLIDKNLRWSGGKTHLVQVGDMLDRGPESRRVLDLYRRLEREAGRAGGRVHVLLGNHEVMRLIGDHRYITPGEYQAFATRASADLQREVIDTVEDPQLRTHLASLPLGAIELLQAFGTKQPYGAYLRTLNSVVRINDIVFVHGGISPALASSSCRDLNARVLRDITVDLAASTANPAAAWSMQAESPLWYRGLAQEPDEFAPTVEAILDAQHARAIVMGHTPQTAGRIGVRFGGRVFLIDTGMQPVYVRTGRPAALEIIGETITAIYPSGRESLARVPAGVLVGAGSR